MMEAKSPARKESWDRIRYLGSKKEILGNSGEECAQNGHEMIKTLARGFPSSAVDKTLLANAGDTSSIPGSGRCQMPRSN